MAYETGSATDRDDLLNKLRIFLVANGWTQNYWAAEGEGYRLHVNKDTVYANFRTSAGAAEKILAHANTWFAMNVSTGYDGTKHWSLQPGAPYAPGGNPGSLASGFLITGSIVSYYFFAQDNSFDVVAEISSGVFRSMHAGELTKFGSYTGGMYMTAPIALTAYWEFNSVFTMNVSSNYPSTFVSFDDGGGLTWFSNTASMGTDHTLSIPYSQKNSTTTTKCYAGAVTSLLAVPPTTEGSTILLPIYYGALQSPYIWPLGYVPHVRICRGDYVANAQEWVLGADTWMLFKTAFCGATTLAIAIKKVV
jgi:hypothetical protein